jgi:uncharacterized protein YciI
MWYAIMSTDIEGSLELRLKTRDAHVARLQSLVAEDRLLVAGPHPAIDNEEPGDAGFSGSLVIVEFPSLEEATQWAEDDPYFEAGVYMSTTVKPFKHILP